VRTIDQTNREPKSSRFVRFGATFFALFLLVSQSACISIDLLGGGESLPLVESRVAGKGAGSCRRSLTTCMRSSVKAGDSLCLLYPSANRDAEFFEDPDSFRIDRSPNHHVGFGIGEYFCLGANLARVEIRVALEKLIPRIEHLELAGPMDRVQSSFLGGVKRMPIRFEAR